MLQKSFQQLLQRERSNEHYRSAQISSLKIGSYEQHKMQCCVVHVNTNKQFLKSESIG